MGKASLQMACLLILSLIAFAYIGEAAEISFDRNYVVRYGKDHVSKLDHGREVQLSLDKTSGAGFMSKKGYSSGFFEMDIKLPQQQSPGLVIAFYLTSNADNHPGNHGEIDFEFLGTDGPPFSLQTNLLANDNGGREQRLKLWFDPTKEFHKYGILWNHHQIVFFVDKIPIRVYKNNTRLGARYPTMPMFLEGSIWNGETWASGGRKVEFSKAPFQVHYRGFHINGCEFGGKCYSQIFWWNRRNYWQLTPNQTREFENVKKKYEFYNYCCDRGQFFKECNIGQKVRRHS